MSASSTSTSSQLDIDVPEDVVHQAVENFGNFLSKEEMSEMVETATPEDLARLETDGKRTNNVLLSGIFTGISVNITIVKWIAFSILHSSSLIFTTPCLKSETTNWTDYVVVELWFL